MKHRLIKMLLILTLLFTWMGLRPNPASAAGGCKNTTCEGYNPYTMGCPATTAGTRKYLPDGYSYVETRVSGTSDCDAKWARTTNMSGGYRYAAATLRYGCANYCYSQYASTPGSIASGQTVYTPMHAYAATPTRSCGDVEYTGPIYVPLSLSDTYCTGTN